MLQSIYDFIMKSLFTFFVPIVCTYFALTSNVFLNIACDEASGFERLGNVLLIPSHYLFVGQIAHKNEMGEWSFSDRFEYNHHFLCKTIVSSLTVIPSFIAGVSVKALSLLGEESRIHQKTMTKALQSVRVDPNHDLYQQAGIDLGIGKKAEWLLPEGYQRKPGDEQNLADDKIALKEIGALFTEAGIPWWVDCGTCLGAYRYGGVIPWDEDIDIAVLIQDFDNVKRTLNKLDSTQYLVQDWSSREHPKSYLKVFVRKSRNLIDIYHYTINPEKREITYLLSLENSWIFPEWWKIRESRFTVPVSYDVVFPLKKALFDGVEVFVPKDTKKFLQRCYGENLAPAKIFDPKSGGYEKDLSHPYWHRAYVH